MQVKQHKGRFVCGEPVTTQIGSVIRSGRFSRYSGSSESGRRLCIITGDFGSLSVPVGSLLEGHVTKF